MNKKLIKNRPVIAIINFLIIEDNFISKKPFCKGTTHIPQKQDNFTIQNDYILDKYFDIFVKKYSDEV
tara:strand:- start:1109 stop:1312 length:204 start_codon:yes stop_codon:yes gene_type:complete